MKLTRNWKETQMEITKKYRIEITPSAAKDLKEIIRFISKDNVTAAKNLAKSIRAKINTVLTTNPYLCTILLDYPVLAAAGYRRLVVHKHYSVLYVIADSSVKIMHIWDNRRNLDLIQ